MRPLEDYIQQPDLLPQADSARWFILNCIRQFVRDGKAARFKPRVINRFLRSLSSEHQLTVLTEMVEQWGALGADRAMFDLLKKVTAHMTAAPPVATARRRRTLARIQKGLRMLTVPLPHLAGLAAAVRVNIDERVPTMGVFASGRLVANPAFTARLTDNELVFVLAHELLHLALRTHERAKGSGQLEFNYAHDYIINDMLRGALGVATIPAGGLDMPGAREKSAEQIVVEMRRNGDFISSRTRVWDGEVDHRRPRVRPAGRGSGGDGAELMTMATCSTTRASASCFPTMPPIRRAAPRRSRTLPPRASRSARPMGAMQRARLRCRRHPAGGRCAARHLRDAVADGAADLARRRRARRAHLRAAVAARRRSP